VRDIGGISGGNGSRTSLSSGNAWNSTGAVITNSRNEGRIEGVAYVGGISGKVGSNNSSVTGAVSTITNCTNMGEVHGTGSYTGGIVGEHGFYAKMSNCINNNIVTGVEYVGGIAGRNRYSDIADCENNNVVTGTVYVGGVIRI
jgi:hypothetical protein